MNTEDAKIETLVDYVVNSKSDIEWCKSNLQAAKENIYLPPRYSQKIKENLFKGILIVNITTGNSIFRRFDYPLKYIQNVMNPGVNQWNKWVIIYALEYKLAEFEDISNLYIKSDYRPKSKKKKRIYKKPTSLEIREHLMKRHNLKAPVVKS